MEKTYTQNLKKQKAENPRIKIRNIYFSIKAHADIDSLMILNFHKYKRTKDEIKKGRKIQQSNQDMGPSLKDDGKVNYKMFKDFCSYFDVPYYKEVRQCKENFCKNLF
jgi:hypothetical protein